MGAARSIECAKAGDSGDQASMRSPALTVPWAHTSLPPESERFDSPFDGEKSGDNVRD